MQDQAASRCTSALAPLLLLALAGSSSPQGFAGGSGEHRTSESRELTVRIELRGFVLEPDGAPAEGALVSSSAGGRTVTDASGGYRLAVDVPLEATAVQVTARGSANRSASTSVGIPAGSAFARVDPLQLARGAPCSPSWLSTFGPAPGMGGVVHSLTIFDDGSGPALHAGGFFFSAGNTGAYCIAKWTGSGWVALGSGTAVGSPPAVNSLTVFDGEGGPTLYAAGTFSSVGGVEASNIASWDGAAWAGFGNGSVPPGRALAVFDDGGGPALHAAGDTGMIARWNGSSFDPLGSGLNDDVLALAVFDDAHGLADTLGSGAALYAGGDFTTAGGAAASRVASWDGSSWAALGSGLNDRVSALVEFDDGSGPALYAGGRFTTAGGASASHVAKWDGSSWAALGSGTDGEVWTLAGFDDGSGPALYAGGTFTTAGGAAANRIAKWDGSSWTALGAGVSGGIFFPVVRALSAHDDGSGAALFVGGDFTTAGGQVADGIARWDGSMWIPLATGINGDVLCLGVLDDGGGPALHAGGTFTGAGGVEVNGVAAWDGVSWAALGSGMAGNPPRVEALTAFDDAHRLADTLGGGSALYAGGQFTSAGGVAASHIAKWDGASWTALGAGTNANVHALTTFDDGSGTALYAGGDFTSAGGLAASRIARWNGVSWSALGGGLSNRVYALAVFDDGSGQALYAGGDFTSAGGVGTGGIAKWNGASWSALGSGLTAARGLAVFDDGSGPALYAGGFFTTAGGVAANHVARWDGSSWSALGSGVGGASGFVLTLAAVDDGSGAALVAGGLFDTAGGVAANSLAKWDGSSWSALGSGTSGHVYALLGFTDGSGPALYAGGLFLRALDSGDSYLARWGCQDTAPPVLSCPDVYAVESFGGAPGEVVTFSVEADDEVDPLPDIVCVPPSGSFFPRGTTLVTCTATDQAGNESTCQFAVTVLLKARRP